MLKNNFETLLQRHKEELEKSMKWSEFILDSIDVLYYDLDKISLNCVGSYIDSPKWPKSKKVTKNPENNDEKCFQYAATVALNHQNIRNNPQRILNIKPFIDQHNWKNIDFSIT